MENEIRKAAMRPFTSVEPMFPALCSTTMAKSRDLPDPRCSAQHRVLPRARSVPVVDEIMAQRIKHLIDAVSYLGYRMVWARLRRQGFRINRKAVQRIMQIKGWQCHRRLKKRCSPRVESSPSVALVSDVRWATDATYVWIRLDGLVYVNAVIDCASARSPHGRGLRWLSRSRLR